MPRAKRRSAEIIEIGGEVPTNAARDDIVAQLPYSIEVTIEGVSDILFHAWNVEAVEEKARAAKGSEAKKTDNIESYVRRDEKGYLCIPGEYLRGTIWRTAKYRQDPRSPRKSAQDLYKAGVVSLTPLASLGIKKWDYLDKRRVLVQRQGINRTRPAVKVGWQATFQLMCILPEYIDHRTLHAVLAMAGRVEGLGDFRPTYGRFQVVNYQILDLAA